jgi:mono/diheme cytochrome c family protein
MFKPFVPAVIIVALWGVALLEAGIGERVASAQGMRPPAPVPQPPFELSDPKAIEEGTSLFRRSCTGYCHGSEGRVARAPKLRGRTDLEPMYLYQRIASGFPPMPAYQTVMPPEDIWKLVAYIMSLRDAQD